MHKLKTIVRLSLRDYFHERLLSSCAILGLAAVLAPLLVLFGVKSGIINTMADRLIGDPRNRQVSPVGSGRYGKGWLLQISKRQDVSFIIPETRSIAANMILFSRHGGRIRTVPVDLIPTAEGDPLLEKLGSIPADRTSIVLSEPAARKLNVTAGQTVVGRVGRSVKGVKEQVTINLKVSAVLTLEAEQRKAAFIRLVLLEAIEDFRDGRGSKAFGWPGQPRPPGPREYPSFRLYSRSIYDVAGLRDMFLDQGIEVYTRAEQIEVVRSLDQSFTLIFSLIAVVAVFGYFASMASNVLANVNRKSRHLAITRLIGFSTGSMVWFPIVQALATSIFGAGVALCLYFVADVVINGLFSLYLSAGEHVCRISAEHLLVALGLTIAMSVLASGYAAFRVSRIEPSEVLRDV